MAITLIDIGSAPNALDGDPLRTAFNTSNVNDQDLDTRIATLEGSAVTAASLIRAEHNIACNGSPGQTITFSAQFVSVYAITIIDFEGIGIEITAQDQDGFTITSLSAGNFSYIATVEV